MSAQPHHNIPAGLTQITAEELRKAFERPEVRAVTTALRKATQELMNTWPKDIPADRKQDLVAAMAAAKAMLSAWLRCLAEDTTPFHPNLRRL